MIPVGKFSCCVLRQGT